MNDEEYLAHYGVLGMKWGVRRASNRLSNATTAPERDSANASLKRHSEKAGRKFEKLSNKALKSNGTLKIYKAPFIVIAMYGGSVGNTAISNIDACTNQACCCVIPHPFIDIKYLFENKYVPISLNKIIEKEIKIKEKKFNVDEAIKTSILKSREKIEEKLSKEEYIINEIQLKVNVKNSKIELEMFYTVYEDITDYLTIR